MRILIARAENLCLDLSGIFPSLPEIFKRGFHVTLKSVVALLAFCLPAASALASPDLSQYPLRVQVFRDHASNHYWDGMYDYSHGHGKANLIDGTLTNAMVYEFRCDGHPTSSEADETYPARWKKPGTEIELLMGRVGSEHITKCSLAVTLKPYVYHVRDGSLITMTQEEWAAWQARSAESKEARMPMDTDYAHYPVKVSLLHLELGEHLAHIYSGVGQGNVLDAQGVPHGVDFAIHCPVQVHESPEGRYYRGRWDVESHQLTILLHSYEDPSKFATCTLKTVMHNDVYLRTAAGIEAVSVAKYQETHKPEVASNTPAGGQ